MVISDDNQIQNSNDRKSFQFVVEIFHKELKDN